MCSVSRIATAILLAAGMFVASGCSGGSSQIHGKVTIDGNPLESGAITLIPEDKSKGQTAGATITQGEFQVVGKNLPPPGLYRIEITGQKKTGKQIPAGSPLPPGTMIDEMVEAVPTKYNTQSELKRELKAGDNTLDFELISEKK